MSRLPDGSSDADHGMRCENVADDKLANGWAFPPGPWGSHDFVFAMRFKFNASYKLQSE